MKERTKIFLILCTFLTISCNKMNQKLKEKKKIDLHPENHFTNEQKERHQREMERGLFIERRLSGQKAEEIKQIEKPFKVKQKEHKKLKKSFRKLVDETPLKDVGFFSLVQDDTKTLIANKYLMDNLKKEESKFILYPYKFDYTKNETFTENNGGVFTFDQESLNDQQFSKIMNITTVNLGQAKSIYDIDIGILSLTYKINGQDADVFAYASTVCNYFISSLKKTSTCIRSKNDYLQYKKAFPTKGAVVYLNHTDILNNTLFDENGELLFKLLIIPSYTTGTESTIFDYFTQNGIDIIKQFREKGGNIIALGTSGYLLEKWNIITQNTYDTTQYLKTTDTIINVDGCQDTLGKTPNEQGDYFKQLICLKHSSTTSLVKAFIMQSIPSGFDSILSLSNSESKLIKVVNKLEDTNIPVSQTYPYLVASRHEAGKGRIVIFNGDPTFNTKYSAPFRNIVLYSMTRNIIFNMKVKFGDGSKDVPIPGGEEGYKLSVEFSFLNLFKESIQDIYIDLLIPPKVVLVQNTLNTSICNMITNSNDLIKYQNYSNVPMRTDLFLRCSINNLNKFTNLSGTFQIEIQDQSVTQKATDIPLIYPFIKYKDIENNKIYDSTPGAFLVQASMAALLRGTFNPDPLGWWPLVGQGIWFDNVLNVENKENTEAINVTYTSVIPLICPIFDGVNEAAISQYVPIYDKYYKLHNYTYPWNDTYNRDEDFIDYAEIRGRSVVYVDDWDTPIKVSKVLRQDLQNQTISNHIVNLYNANGNEKPDDYANQIYTTNSAMLLKQIYFGDSDKFYERAKARISLFIDDTTVEGAQALYGGTVPNDVIDPTTNNTARVELGWCRSDIFFWDSSQYMYPKGINNTIFFSVDRFIQIPKASPENANFGFLKSKLVNPGYYDSSRPLRDTLKPNEFSNVLRQYQSMTQIDPSNPTDLNKINELITNNTFKYTHYLVPVAHKKIHRANNIMNFTETNSEGEGKLTPYPQVKFIFAHSIDIKLDPKEARLGGIVKVKLGSTTFSNSIIDPVKEDKILTSADNVAFYKTEYDSVNKIISLYYKRGLMPNENYGFPSNCQIYIEGLVRRENITVDLEFYETKFDFAYDELESSELLYTNTNVNAHFKAFFSLPAIQLENKLQRSNSANPEVSGSMLEYELLNPYTRYGIYFQELLRHTSVWSSAEAHHPTDPGITSISGAFALLSAIGTSMVPFADYVTHGGLMIPGAISTTRIEWTDVWGRHWVQNLRSLFPDIPPLPGPVLNFMMSTTFELLTVDKEERVLEWQSDESVYIRVQMKFLNNYWKFFEPDMCKMNQLPYQNNAASDFRALIFITQDSDYDEYRNTSKITDKEHFVGLGVHSVYGTCYNNSGSYLSGVEITPNIYSNMSLMMQCAETNDAQKMNECSKMSDRLGLPKLNKRPNDTATDNSPNKTWNYSPLIDKYHPKGYINETAMWDLTKQYYEDSPFLKGFPFRYDNGLPSLEASPPQNPAYNKPHNLIAFPIYKGFGYEMSYSNKYTLKKFPGYKGWWSDQLQNKDNTLLAGQEKNNEVSVDKDSLLQDSDWIHSSKLINTANSNLIKNRLKNIYVCKYNQYRVKVKPGQEIYSIPETVYKNYIVPIDPNLESNAPEYTNYNCSGENAYQYSPQNISLVDNRVYTGNVRDWLYFGLALRGEAKENLNVIMKLDPFSDRKYEGITKIQDGGRFTYWNPALGPNAFNIVDDVVNTVIGKRTDLEITQAMYPTTLQTFKQYGYQLFKVFDKNEEKREYTMSTYTNSYGFGDSAITVYVGGTEHTYCKLTNSGEYTYVKIAFYNNAGFDWHLKGNAISFNSTGISKPINAFGLLEGIITNIQKPLAYNFMKLNIPSEIAPYIKIEPSDHNIDVAPQFFDFTTINVVTIRDGFEGSYFYKITLIDDIPENLRGRFWEIKVDLIETYFDRLPSYNDPTKSGFHDYHLKIPSIKIAFPYKSGVNAGKVFYILGQAKNIQFSFKLYKYFNIEDIKIIHEDNITSLDIAIQSEQYSAENLTTVWDSLPKTSRASLISYTEKDEKEEGSYYKIITVNLTDAYSVLPFEIFSSELPYENKIFILVKSYASQVDAGYKNLLKDSIVYFNDFRKDKKKNVDVPTYVQCYTKGPWIYANVESTIVVLNETSGNYRAAVGNELSIYKGDSKIVKETINLRNSGTAIGYNNNFVITLDKRAVLLNNNGRLDSSTTYVIQEKKEYNEMVISYGGYLSSGDEREYTLYFEVTFNEEESQLRELADSDTTKLKIIKKINATLCTKDINCSPSDLAGGEEEIIITNSISFRKKSRYIGTIKLNVKNIGTEILPKYALQAVYTLNSNAPSTLGKIYYTYYRKIEGTDKDYVIIKEKVESAEITDEPFSSDNVNSAKVYYKVDAVTEKGLILTNENEEKLVINEIEELEDKTTKKFPLWLLILLVILIIIILSLIAYSIYRYEKNKKGQHVKTDSRVDLPIPNKSVDVNFSGKSKDGKDNSKTNQIDLIDSNQIKIYKQNNNY